MSPFTFVHSVQSNEVLVGTCVDIAAITGQVPSQTFENTEALVQKLQTFRSQEIIITFVSNDDELQRQWNEPYLFNLRIKQKAQNTTSKKGRR